VVVGAAVVVVGAAVVVVAAAVVVVGAAVVVVGAAAQQQFKNVQDTTEIEQLSEYKAVLECALRIVLTEQRYMQLIRQLSDARDGVK